MVLIIEGVHHVKLRSDGLVTLYFAYAKWVACLTENGEVDPLSHTGLLPFSDFNYFVLCLIESMINRLEKLDIRSSRSQAKLVGTLVSISGALVVTLYKGTSIWSSSQDLHHRQQSPHNSVKAENWVLGALFLATACLSASIWNIIQVKSKKYTKNIIISCIGMHICTVHASYLH